MKKHREGCFTYCFTIALWLLLCALTLVAHINHAANAPPDSIDEYARAGSYQVMVFFFYWLPILVLMLLAVLAIEKVLFMVSAKLFKRKRMNDNASL